jgi:arginyl-tRNA synthetase
VKNELLHLLRDTLQQLQGSVLPSELDLGILQLERTRDSQHGDFACNVALKLAKPLARKPRDIAQDIVAALGAHPLIERVDIAGAGFINFFVSRQRYCEELQLIHAGGEAYGRHQLDNPKKILLEFVSANPTGPMHVGHGRQAAYGDTLGKILSAAGHQVFREYYINDAGRQTEILAVSVWLRYLERCGETVRFPENGYRADYLLPLAEDLYTRHGNDWRHSSQHVLDGLPPDAPEGNKDQHVDALITRCRQLIGESCWHELLNFSLAQMMAEIRDDLAGFAVSYDRWTSEREFAESGAIDRALDQLRTKDLLYTKDGAEWFKATQFGDDEDRVVIRDNGVKTYFASDIAYHLDKRQRGFDLLIDVLGADHHGYVARVRGGLQALGQPADCLEVCLVQLVSLFRDGVKLSMGKREGNFVTLRQLRDEVGNDACRIFYLMRSNDQALDFDLELAKSKSNENPVFYIQYAHARVASVMREISARGLAYEPARASDILGQSGARLLGDEHAGHLLKMVSRYPEIIEQAAAMRAPHTLVHYLRELANALHSFYNAERILVDDESLRHARVYALQAVQQVLRNGLSLLGVSAPESM